LTGYRLQQSRYVVEIAARQFDDVGHHPIPSRRGLSPQ
jgi:hypothetical protein